MYYRKFIIENYRAIQSPTTIDLDKYPLMPIIGVNESGKTTILHAIFAFDRANDVLYEGRHLEDTRNLYSLESPSAKVSAELGFGEGELFRLVSGIENSRFSPEELHEIAEAAPKCAGTVVVTRDLETKRYSTNLGLTDKAALDHVIAQELVGNLPWVLFFDDFRDSVDDKIEITKKDEANTWLEIMERLFQRAAGVSVHAVPEMEARQRRTLLARVNKHLNDTLTREWRTFRIDDSDALEIEITFEPGNEDGAVRNFLKLSIAEKTADGETYYFHIRDRSKGFFWFFNFVMKLQFNPKVLEESEQGSIYLLDEPGSYLHSTAQRRLCRKLVTISEDNRVLYCTHSHYLLDPDSIPLGSINVAQKDHDGSISLYPIHSYRGTSAEQRSAFQPVLDALEIQQFSLELRNGPMVITEGIVDFYALEMFRGGANFTVMPGSSADSIQYHVSRCIAWQIPFTALWDNDDEGRKAEKKATKAFGKAVAEDHFRKLPLKGERATKRILQNLFEGQDIKTIKAELGLPKNAQFDKTIMLLYHNPTRAEILSKVSEQTKANFAEVIAVVTPKALA